MANEIAQGTVLDGSILDRHVAANAGLDAGKLALRALANFPQDLLRLRAWDALEVPLCGVGNAKAAALAAAARWDPNSADETFFTAGRKYRVVGITSRVEVAGTDGGAVTAVVKKAPSGTAIAAGTALHTGSINLKGAAATNQGLTLSATPADLDIAIGDSVGIDYAGTLTSARGTVSVLLAPAAGADDLLVYTGTYGANAPQVRSRDLKSAGAASCRARLLVALPDHYVPGGSVSIRCNAGMNTTAADTSATVAVEAYRVEDDGTLSGNLVTTAAQACNSLTLANFGFTVTPAGLVAGNRLDVRVTFAVNDAAGITAVVAVLHDLVLRCDVRP